MAQVGQMADAHLLRQGDDWAMSRVKPRKRTYLAAAVIGLSAAGAVVGHARADEPQPKRVTGVSFALETMRTGNQIGAAEVYALALSAAGSAVPAKGTFGPADPVVQQATQQAVLAAGSQGANVSKVTDAGDSGIAQTESAVQPLAALNGPANQAIDTASNALNTAAQALGPEIQPVDTTVKQGALFLQELKAQP
jgi:hypothetical protein